MDTIDLCILLGAAVLLILPVAIPLLIGCLKISSQWARWEEEEERKRNERGGRREGESVNHRSTKR